MTRPPSTRRSLGAAFTLLEVMAAVAVFAIVYVVLARTTIAGLGVEGEARRRMAASLLADATLAELEAEVRSGEDVRPTEREVEGYQIRTHTEPADLAALGLALAPQPGDPREGEPRTPPADRPSLLRPDPATGEAPLRALHVEVSWDELGSTQQVVRTSFAWVAADAAPLLEDLGNGDGAPGPDERGAGRPRDAGGDVPLEEGR